MLGGQGGLLRPPCFYDLRKSKKGKQMVAVYDPTGTPTITYSRSGRVTIPLTTINDSSFAGAVKIPHIADETFVIVNSSAGQGAVYFDSEFEYGDVVSILVYSNQLNVYGSGGGLFGTITETGPVQTGRFLFTPVGWVQIGL